MLLAFPPEKEDWFNPLSSSLTIPTVESAPDISQDAPSHPPKLRSPSAESCICPSCGEALLNLADGCGVCGWVQSPKAFLGDKLDEEISPRKIGDESEFLGDKLDEEVSPRKIGDESEFLGDKLDEEISPRKIRRTKGGGSGSIYWRTITKNGKDYPQAYYHYEFWSRGDRLIKSTKYIPKKLLAQIQELEAQKAPVREILGLLGVMV